MLLVFIRDQGQPDPPDRPKLSSAPRSGASAGAVSLMARLGRDAQRRWGQSPGLRRSLYGWTGAGLLLAVAGGFSAGDLGGRAGVGAGLGALWWLLSTGCLLLCLPLLRRHPEGTPVQTLGVPNGVTMLRVDLAVPLLLFAALPAQSQARSLFLAIAVPLAALDAMDGLIARVKGPVTVLGRALDPVSDTVFFSVCALGSLLAGFIPVWMALLILVRYGLPALGFLLLYPWRPRRPAMVATSFGKINTVASALSMGISAVLVLARGPAGAVDIGLAAVLGATALGHFAVLARRIVTASSS